jgi:CheY-like chemotaxis protein
VKKILVVDDEPDARAYVTALLEDNDYTVLSAHNADTGMALIEREGADLILVDVMMPGASGLSLVHKLRSDPKYAGTPVILVTGKPEVLEDGGCSYLDRFRVKPPEGILEKPFDPSSLLSMVESFLCPGT